MHSFRLCIIGFNRSASTLRLSKDRGSATSLQLLWSYRKPLSTSSRYLIEGRSLEAPNERSVSHEESYDDLIGQRKEKQTRTPWHREGANVPPVRRQRSAGAMVKGKLLTTPSRLLKLVIPLTTVDMNEDRKSIEPLALVVHPNQPLSYLERLIQSELPAIRNEKGDEKIPSVNFKAENSSQDEMTGDEENQSQDESEGLERTNIDGKIERTGVINPKKNQPETNNPQSAKDSGVESYSGAGREGPSAEEKEDTTFVRWSSSTEIGDFIRDAARGKEFIVEIEGLQEEIRIGVPSFRDRTFYLRQRLRRAARKISEMAKIKEECDQDAHRAAQRIAIGGFVVLVFWWIGVYYLTFETSLGWDTMEPVTYLVSFTGLICGYLWFLYHNREVSYRAAMNLTISRRQSQLYAAKQLNLSRWEELVRDANALRDEIKKIASEYDVEWNEAADEHDETVRRALKRERDKRNNADAENEDDDVQEKDHKESDAKKSQRGKQKDN